MSEGVSSRIFDIFIKELPSKSFSVQDLAESGGVSVVAIRDPKQRVTWPEFVRIMAAIGRIWSDDELVNLGGSTLRAGSLKALGYAARLLFAPADLYQWVFRTGGGAGHQFFPDVMPTTTQVGPNLLEIVLEITGGLASCREFFFVSKGNMEALPCLLGLPSAQVEMELRDGSARYLVHLPPGGGWLTRARQALLAPFTAGAVARELRVSHDELAGRYVDLEKARSVLAKQAENLETLNELGQRLTLVSEMTALRDALDQVLRERMKLRGARIVPDKAAGGSAPILEIGSQPSPPDQAFPLLATGNQMGTLEVWHDTAAGPPEILKDFIPWVSIAYDHARSFQILEQRVAERTAELQTTNAKLDVALAEQKAADQQRAAFFANASHELRTPLTLLIGPLERLASNRGLPSAAADETNGALKNAYRLLKLVNDVLDVSKIEAGRLTLKRVNTDLSRQLHDIAQPWKIPTEKRGVRLTVEVPPSLVVVADPERIDQVALNLVSNAVRYTPDGGDLAIRAGRSGDRVWFSVENSGEPIAAEDLPHLFERFGQATNARGRRFGSTGLGLAVVHDIVQLHGGDIRVESQPGKNVCFRVELPAQSHEGEAVQQGSAPSAAEVLQYQAAGQRGQVMRVDTARSGDRPLLLVVEDNPELSEFLTTELRTLYDIAIAGDGLEGLELARKRHPDLILSDVMMPRMDGLEMLQALQGQEVTRSIPVIMLTARGDLGARMQGLEKGADDYIVKPFHMDEVKARIAIQLKLQRLAREVAQREKLAAMGTLVAGVAHEVRNPLNGIVNALGPVRDMLGDAPEQETARELLDLALQATRRVEEISALLLQQSRTHATELDHVKLRENVELALRLLSFKTADGPQVTNSVAADLPDALADPGTLNQVWVNLIDNAICAAGPKGTVSITAEERPEGLAVTVADDGPGIPEDIRDRIFDPFFTTKPVGQGTGLGLSVVREIVSRQGGAVRLESSPRGTRFLVTLKKVQGGRVGSEQP